MWIKLYIVVLVSICMQISTEAERRNCGGTLTANKGILTTPNFPGPFKVPMKCQWIIDASNTPSPNSSIVVYLTQLFLFEGLSFTEYQLYGDDYKINPKLIHRVNETNISRVRWVQTYQAYLVIELNLLSVDSAHLRVLDKFLDVYGFNITYEITTTGLRTPSCTMMDCGFTGVCYDYYTKFACECFPGYTGPSCSEGPKSICNSAGYPVCKNKATCLHVGVSNFKCYCPQEFTGTTCEIPTDTTSSKDCSNCSNGCAFYGKSENECKCIKAPKSSHRHGFEITLHMGNLPNLESDDLKNYIRLQLLNHLHTSLPRPEDLEITNLIYFMSGADVTFQVYGSKNDEKRIKNIVNMWIDKSFIGNITISEKDDSIKTLLSVQSLDINQPGEIEENDEFILSCVARGSPAMTFRWYKDGAAVNLTFTGYKWTKLIKDPHVADQYMAVFAVEKAQQSDEGVFTCQVEVFNYRQCLSKFVRVRKKPPIKIEPMSLTVRKGDKFTVKCITGTEGVLPGKYTYSWTKNKELLPIRTESEKYDILYPTGTILQVFKAEKDVRYSCLVQDATTSTERNIYVYVIDDKKVHTCQQESKYKLLWPETAPNAESILECPDHFLGTAVRKCILQDGRNPVWSSPDFSQCTHETLDQFYKKFEEFKAGYAVSTPEDTLKSFLHYIKELRSENLLPGEGARILHLTQNIVGFLPFLRALKTPISSLDNITGTIFQIVDELSSIPNALINPADIQLLQEVIVNHLKLNLVRQSNFTILNYFLDSIDITIVNRTRNRILIPITAKISKKMNWISSSLSLPGSDLDYAEPILRIVFRNVSTFFPPKSFLRTKDGTEVEYEIFSQVVSVISLSQAEKTSHEKEFIIEFRHRVGAQDLNVTKRGKWTIKCGHADSTAFAYTWDITSCLPDYSGHMTTKCRCSKYGSFVLLLLSQSEVLEGTNDPQNYILLAGSIVGMILTLITVSCVGIACLLVRGSYILTLELQCSFTIFLFQVLFTLGIVLEPPQQYLIIFITFLEMFLLMAISSNLSKLLIVFTELIYIPKAKTSKFTVTGIISGVPVITVFGNHLAYRTMNDKFESWWMIVNSLAFNIFIIVLSIITLMFVFIYLMVVKKLQQLFAVHETHRQAIKKRISLVNQTGCVFISIFGFTISSIIYVNVNKSIWNIYQFIIANLCMGSSLLIFYVITSETKLRDIIKWKSKKDSSLFSTEFKNNPLNFLTSKETKSTDERVSRTNVENRHCLNPTEGIKTTEKTPNVSNAFESYFHMSSIFCGETRKETFLTNELQPSSELYNVSSLIAPIETKEMNRKLHSPDIITTKLCVELDLVASSIHVKKTNSTIQNYENSTEENTYGVKYSSQIETIPEDDYIQTCSEEFASTVEKCVESTNIGSLSTNAQMDATCHPQIVVTDLTSQMEEAEQGNSSSQLDSENITPIFDASDDLNGVLDSISQDLNYLLNGDSDPIPTLSQKRVCTNKNVIS